MEELTVVAAGMAPVVVVGEDREGEPAEKAVQAQVDAWLPDVPAAADVLVAYEPAWAIGQPRPAPPEHVARSPAAARLAGPQGFPAAGRKGFA